MKDLMPQVRHRLAEQNPEGNGPTNNRGRSNREWIDTGLITNIHILQNRKVGFWMICFCGKLNFFEELNRKYEIDSYN